MQWDSLKAIKGAPTKVSSDNGPQMIALDNTFAFLMTSWKIIRINDMKKST